MRKSLPIAVLSSALTAIVYWMFTSKPQAADNAKTTTRIQKWEYTHGGLGDDEHLQKLGDEGWEICAMNFTSQNEPWIVWLKRPKND